MYPPQLYPNSTIQFRSGAHRAAQDLVYSNLQMNIFSCVFGITNSQLRLKFISLEIIVIGISDLRHADVLPLLIESIDAIDWVHVNFFLDVL